MGPGKLGQMFSARELSELVRDDLKLVEKEIGLESVASAEAVTTIAQYLHASGG